MNAVWLPLSSNLVSASKHAYFAGWGSPQIRDQNISLFEAQMSTHLSVIKVRIRGNTVCKNAYPYANFAVWQMCATSLKQCQITGWVIMLKMFYSIYPTVDPHIETHFEWLLWLYVMRSEKRDLQGKSEILS